MAIPLLELDDRRFADIIAELQAMIPNYAPAWTNHNLADPGITVMELFAWLTEALIYRVNRVPESSQRRFFELLGAAHQPPTPALLKLRVSCARELTLARHTPLFAYPDDGRDAIPLETVEDTVFTPDLPERMVLVRQTEQLVDVPAGTMAASGAAGAAGVRPFPLFRLDQPFALPDRGSPRPPYLEIAGLRWEYTPSLHKSGPGSLHFTIKRERVVVFGDGAHGKIPPARAAIYATWRTARRPGAWRRGEKLGTSSGRAWQTFQLSAPPLADDLQPPSDLEPLLHVTAPGKVRSPNGSPNGSSASGGAGGAANWRYSPSLLAIDGNWNEFTVEPWVNGIRFGNGRDHGALPEPGAEITVTYRATLGRFDPLGSDTDFGFAGAPELRNSLRVKDFTVLRPGTAGASLADARRAAMDVIKPVWRGVTSSDLSAVVLAGQADTFSLQSRAGDSLAAVDANDAVATVYQPAKLGVLATPRPRYVLEDKSGELGRVLALGPDGRSLVTQTPGGTARGAAADTGGGAVRLWHLTPAFAPAAGLPSVSVLLVADGEPALTFSPDGSRLLVHTQAQATDLFDTASGQSLLGENAPQAAAISLLSPDGSRWLTVSADRSGAGTLRSGEDGSAIALLRPRHVVAAAFSADSSQLGTLHARVRRRGGSRLLLQLRSAADGKPKPRAVLAPSGSNYLLFSPDGRLVLAAAERRVTVYRTADAAVLGSFDLPAPLAFVTGCLQFSPTGTRLLTICADGAAYLWSLHTYTQVARLLHDPAGSPVAGAVYSRDGLRLATYDGVGGLCVWRAQPGRLEARFTLDAAVAQTAFNDDATRLAAVGVPVSVPISVPISAPISVPVSGGAVRIWDLARGGRELLKVERTGGAAINTAGRWVAWVEDNLAPVWDMDADSVTATLHHGRREVDERVTMFGPAAGGPLLLTFMERPPEPGTVQERRVQVWNAAQVHETQTILDDRRLITSQPAARGPHYDNIGLEAVLVRTMPPRQSLKALRSSVLRALYAFFDPLTGGPDGKGWMLGRPVHRSEVFQVLEQTAGIDHVEQLRIFKRGSDQGSGQGSGQGSDQGSGQGSGQESQGGQGDAGAADSGASASLPLEQIAISDHCLVNLVIEPQDVQVRDPQRLPFVVPV